MYSHSRPCLGECLFYPGGPNLTRVLREENHLFLVQEISYIYRKVKGPGCGAGLGQESRNTGDLEKLGRAASKSSPAFAAFLSVLQSEREI